MNKNGYSTVRSWRDDVGETLGRIDERTKNTEEKLDKALEEQGNQDKRIGTLETTESNRKAVQRKMNALIAFIVMIVTFLSNIAWKIVH
jgi:hypothetical protein